MQIGKLGPGKDLNTDSVKEALEFSLSLGEGSANPAHLLFL